MRQRERRIDAAYDTLRPMGFSKSEIKRTIEDLKKVYGGNDAWVFIEEGSYKLLIDTILENQEQARAVVAKENNAEGDEFEGYGSLQISSSAERKPEHFSIVAGDSGNKGTAMMNKPVGQSAVQGEERVALVQLVVQFEEKDVVQPTVQLDDIDYATNNIPLLILHGNESQDPVSGNGYLTKSSDHIDCLTVRRQPCYGWLVENDDKEDEILDLSEPGAFEAACRMVNDGIPIQRVKPASKPCTEVELMSSRTLNDCKKRKSGWDEKSIM